jgi:hypothetical protein
MTMTDTYKLRDHKGILWERGKRQRPSEGELAERFAERYARQLRFYAGDETHRKGWIVWDGEEWLLDAQNLALHLSRGVCKEAADAYGDHSIDSHRSVAGVLALAKADPRLAVDSPPGHPDIEAATEEWLEAHCELDPEAWTSTDDIVADLPECLNWDDEDTEEVWAQYGIEPEQRDGVWGYRGVRVVEARDE